MSMIEAKLWVIINYLLSPFSQLSVPSALYTPGLAIDKYNVEEKNICNLKDVSFGQCDQHNNMSMHLSHYCKLKPTSST